MLDKHKRAIRPGDVLIDGDGIYEVEKVKVTEVWVHEVEIDDMGFSKQVGDTRYLTKYDASTCTKI